MAMFNSFAIGLALSAIILGILMSEYPKTLGVYRMAAQMYPPLLGLTPAFNYQIEEGFSIAELEALDLSGQTALVTGANSGVGFETAKALAKLGASVTLACRNPTRCEGAADVIRRDKATKGQVAIATVDTSSLQSVKDFSLEFLESNEKLDMLYLNAGIYTGGRTEDGSLPLSIDGIEKVFATNVVGHHLMYKLLEPLLQNSTMARVVAVSSASSIFEVQDTKMKVPTDLDTLNNMKQSFFSSRDSQVYGQSKLAQVYWAQELTERLGAESSIYVNSVHPGMVYTGIQRKTATILKMPEFVFELIQLFGESTWWSAQDGALTQLYLGVAIMDIKEKDIRGKYYHPIAHPLKNPNGSDRELQTRIWTFLESLVADYV